MAIRKIAMVEATCERCGYKWIARNKELPAVCAKCHSVYWNKPRVVKADGSVTKLDEVKNDES